QAQFNQNRKTRTDQWKNQIVSMEESHRLEGPFSSVSFVYVYQSVIPSPPVNQPRLFETDSPAGWPIKSQHTITRFSTMARLDRLGAPDSTSTRETEKNLWSHFCHH
ncbi:unnamed protein product, partial [Ectocarpus sp. 13 AM-2016]